MKELHVAPSENGHLWYVWETDETTNESFIIYVCLSEAEAERKCN